MRFLGHRIALEIWKERDKRNTWKREMKQNDGERKRRRRREHIVEEIKKSEIDSEYERQKKKRGLGKKLEETEEKNTFS